MHEERRVSCTDMTFLVPWSMEEIAHIREVSIPRATNGTQFRKLYLKRSSGTHRRSKVAAQKEEGHSAQDAGISSQSQLSLNKTTNTCHPSWSEISDRVRKKSDDGNLSPIPLARSGTQLYI